MNGNRLHGAWRLLSFDLHSASAPDAPALFQPLGESPLGRILFSSTGYMSCLLTSLNAATPIESTSWAGATDEEILNASRSMTTYCGPYTTFEEDGDQLLSTAVEIALDPNWIGKPQVRKWEYKKTGTKELLILRPIQNFSFPVSVTSAIIFRSKNNRRS